MTTYERARALEEDAWRMLDRGSRDWPELLATFLVAGDAWEELGRTRQAERMRWHAEATQSLLSIDRDPTYREFERLRLAVQIARRAKRARPLSGVRLQKGRLARYRAGVVQNHLRRVGLGDLFAIVVQTVVRDPIALVEVIAQDEDGAEVSLYSPIGRP